MYKSDHLGTTNRIQDVLSHSQAQSQTQPQLHCNNPGPTNMELYLGHHVATHGRHISSATNTCTIKPTATKPQPLSTTSVLRQWRRPEAHDALTKLPNNGLSSTSVAAPVPATTTSNRFVKEVANYHTTNTNSHHNRYGVSPIDNHTDIINTSAVVNNNSVQMYGEYAPQDVSYYQHAEHGWQHQQHVPVASGYNLPKAYNEYQGGRVPPPPPMQKEPKQANPTELFPYAKPYTSVQAPHPNYNYYPPQYDARYMYPNAVPPNRNGVITKPMQKPTYPILEQRLNYYYPQPQTIPQQQNQEMYQEYPYQKYVSNAIPPSTHKLMSSSNPVPYRGLNADPYRGINTDWKLRDEYDSNVYLSKMNQMQTKLPPNPLDYQNLGECQKYQKLPGAQAPNQYLYPRNHPNPVQYSQAQSQSYNVPNIHYSSTTPEMPQRNISPRRTFQENMPVVVIPRQHIGLLKLSPPLYNSSDYLNTGQVVQPTPVQPFQPYQTAQVQQQSQHPIPYTQNVHANYLEQNVETSSLGYCPKKDDIGKSLKEFLESWEDDEEIVSNLPDLVLCNNLPADKAKHERALSPVKRTDVLTSDEPLYILDATDVSSEALAQYKHIQQIDRLPDNIKGYYPDPKLPESDQVLNLSTHRHEFTPEKEQDESSSSTSEETVTSSNTTDNSDGDEFAEKGTEKCVTTSVIVPNTYFDTSKDDCDLHCTLTDNPNDTSSHVQAINVTELNKEIARPSEIQSVERTNECEESFGETSTKISTFSEPAAEITHEDIAGKNVQVQTKSDAINEEIFDGTTKMHKETNAFDADLISRDIEDLNRHEINENQLNTAFCDDVPDQIAVSNNEEVMNQRHIADKSEEAAMKNVQQNTTKYNVETIEQIESYRGEPTNQCALNEDLHIQQSNYNEEIEYSPVCNSKETKNHCKVVNEDILEIDVNIQQSNYNEEIKHSPVRHSEEARNQSEAVNKYIPETDVKSFQQSYEDTNEQNPVHKIGEVKNQFERAHEDLQETNIKNTQGSKHFYDEEPIEEAKKSHEIVDEILDETKNVQNCEQIAVCNSEEATNSVKRVEDVQETNLKEDDCDETIEQIAVYNNEEEKNEKNVWEINTKNSQEIEHHSNENVETKDSYKMVDEDVQELNLKIDQQFKNYNEEISEQVVLYNNEDGKNMDKVAGGDVQEEINAKSSKQSKCDYDEDIIEDTPKHQCETNKEDLLEINVNIRKSENEADGSMTEQVEDDSVDEDNLEVNLKESEQTSAFDKEATTRNSHLSTSKEMDKHCKTIEDVLELAVQETHQDVHEDITGDLELKNLSEELVLNIQETNVEASPERNVFDDDTIERIETPHAISNNEDLQDTKINTFEDIRSQLPVCNDTEVEISTEIPEIVSTSDQPEDYTACNDIDVQDEYEITNEEQDMMLSPNISDFDDNSTGRTEIQTVDVQNEHDEVQNEPNSVNMDKQREDIYLSDEDAQASECDSAEMNESYEINTNKSSDGNSLQNSDSLLSKLEEERNCSERQAVEERLKDDSVVEISAEFTCQEEKNVESDKDEEANKEQVVEIKSDLDRSEENLTSNEESETSSNCTEDSTEMPDGNNASESDNSESVVVDLRAEQQHPEMNEEYDLDFHEKKSELVEKASEEGFEHPQEITESVEETNENFEICDEIENSRICGEILESSDENTEICEEIVETSAESMDENFDTSEAREEMSQPLNETADESLENFVICEEIEESLDEEKINDSIICVEIVESEKEIGEENVDDSGICLELYEPLNVIVEEEVEGLEVCEETVAVEESEFCLETAEKELCLEVTEEEPVDASQLCLDVSEPLSEINESNEEPLEPIDSNEPLDESTGLLEENYEPLEEPLKETEQPLGGTEVEETRKSDDCLECIEPFNEIEVDKSETPGVAELLKHESESLESAKETEEDLEVSPNDGKATEVDVYDPEKATYVDKIVLKADVKLPSPLEGAHKSDICSESAEVTSSDPKLEASDISSDESSLEEGELVSESDNSSDCIFISSTKLPMKSAFERRNDSDSEEEILIESSPESEDDELALHRETINRIKELSKLEPDNIEKKELFINPQNPLYERLSLNKDTNNNRKRCVSSSDSAQIEFTAPKRRYSALEIQPAKSLRRPIINLDEISRNVQQVLENMSKSYDANLIHHEPINETAGEDNRSHSEFNRESSAEDMQAGQVTNQLSKSFVGDFTDITKSQYLMDETPNGDVQISSTTHKKALYNLNQSPKNLVGDFPDNLNRRNPSLMKENPRDFAQIPTSTCKIYPCTEVKQPLTTINCQNSVGDLTDSHLNSRNPSLDENPRNDVQIPSSTCNISPLKEMNQPLEEMNFKDPVGDLINMRNPSLMDESSRDFKPTFREMNQYLKNSKNFVGNFMDGSTDYVPILSSTHKNENHPSKITNAKIFIGDFITDNLIDYVPNPPSSHNKFVHNSNLAVREMSQPSKNCVEDFMDESSSSYVQVTSTTHKKSLAFNKISQPLKNSPGDIQDECSNDYVRIPQRKVVKEMNEPLEINRKNTVKDSTDYTPNIKNTSLMDDEQSPLMKNPFRNFNPEVRKMNQPMKICVGDVKSSCIKDENSTDDGQLFPYNVNSFKTMNHQNFVESCTDNLQMKSPFLLDEKNRTDDVIKSYKCLSIEQELWEIDTNKFLFEDTFKECSLIASTVDFSHLISSNAIESVQPLFETQLKAADVVKIAKRKRKDSRRSSLDDKSNASSGSVKIEWKSIEDVVKTSTRERKDSRRSSLDDKSNASYACVKFEGKSRRKSSLGENCFNHNSYENKNKMTSETDSFEDKSKKHPYDVRSTKLKTPIDLKKHSLEVETNSNSGTTKLGKDSFDSVSKKDTFDDSATVNMFEEDLMTCSVKKLPFEDELVQNPKVLVTPLFPRRSRVDPRLNKEKFEEPLLGSTFHLTEYTKHYIQKKIGQVSTDVSQALNNNVKKPIVEELLKPKEDLKRKLANEPDQNDAKRIKINLQDYRNRKQADPATTIADESTKEPKPKKRKKRFRNLYASDEEEAQPDPVVPPNPYDFKCHIRLDALGDSVIRNYEINRNGATKLTLTLKPKTAKPAFAEVLSSLDTIITERHQKKAKQKSKTNAWPDDKVPKVIIKRNRNGYCAVYTDVSCNPIWQPKIYIKRQPHVEMLVSKYSKGR